MKFINKVKEKYNLTNVREDELKILSNIQSELSYALANRVGGVGSEKDIMAGQANLQRVLIAQNWMILNSLHRIEESLNKDR